MVSPFTRMLLRAYPLLFLSAMLQPPLCEAQEPLVQEVNDYRITLRSCVRNRQQVTCDFEVVNLSDQDRVLMVDTAQLGSIVSNSRHEALGVTTLVDDEGNEIVATRARFANFDSHPSGQSDFKVLSDTKPTLKIVFDGVGLSLRKANRIDLAAGERGETRIDQFPVVFEDVVIQGTAAGGGPPSADDAPDAEKIEAEDYVVRFHQCSRTTGATAVVCSGDLTNLLDRDRTIYFSTRRNGLHRNSLDELGVSSLVDDEGNTYEASSVVLADKEGNASSGQSWFPIEAWKRQPFKLRFDDVPSDVNTLARFDLVLADKRANQHHLLNARFTEIRVAKGTAAAKKKPATGKSKG